MVNSHLMECGCLWLLLLGFVFLFAIAGKPAWKNQQPHDLRPQVGDPLEA